jgi:hypothetical protein
MYKIKNQATLVSASPISSYRPFCHLAPSMPSLTTFIIRINLSPHLVLHPSPIRYTARPLQSAVVPLVVSREIPIS